MTDTVTKKPLKAEHHINDMTTIWLPLSQVPQMRELLDAHGFRYWFWEGSLSDMGQPFMTEVTFYPGTDPKKVQEVLDSIP